MKRNIEVVVGATLKINIKDLISISNAAWKTTKQLFTYNNPKFLENLKWGYSNHDTPRYIYSYQIIDGYIYISRGGLEKLRNHLLKFKVEIVLFNETRLCEPITFPQSKTILREDQILWVNEILKHDICCAQAYTSFGKTVSSCEIIKNIKQRAVILVHTTFLQKQWIGEITNKKLFNLSQEDIGGVGGLFSKKSEFNAILPDATYKARKLGKVNVCLYQSMTNKKHLNFFEPHTGILIFDEGQKTPIDGIQKIVNNFRSKYKYAVSARFKRKDGKECLTFDSFGNIKAIAEELESESKILSHITFIRSDYQDNIYSLNNDYTGLITRMSLNKERNILICRRAIQRHREGKMVMIQVERKEQAAILYHMLSNYKVDMLIGTIDKSKLNGDQRTKNDIKTKLPPRFVNEKIKKILLNYDEPSSYDRVKLLSDKKKLDFIIGTQKVEVGLSFRPLDVVIVTTPVGNNLERFNQLKGRVERTYSDEQEVYFGHPKPIPNIDVIVDINLDISRKAKENIKAAYSSFISKNKKVNLIKRRER